jgi:hypothetical protein
MSDEEIVQTFANLFVGRTDAYGTDQGGACWQAVTLETYERHLTGTEPIGIYPVVNNMVRWGCCDIDTGDWSEAYLLATALRGMGLVPWVERSRSKGWHIWIFLPEFVTSTEMRRCLKVAYKAIDLPAKEANPKSEVLRPNQLGNYVRLPYKAGLVRDPERQTMMTNWTAVNDGTPVPLWAFDANFYHPGRLYSDPAKVKHWASKWYEPARRSTQITTDVDDVDVLRLADLLPSDWRKIWLTGEVRDRSATFVAMAHNLAKSGWQPQDVYNILWGCPWNKYRDRRDGEGYVQDIVDRAYS